MHSGECPGGILLINVCLFIPKKKNQLNKAFKYLLYIISILYLLRGIEKEASPPFLYVQQGLNQVSDSHALGYFAEQLD